MPEQRFDYLEKKDSFTELAEALQGPSATLGKANGLGIASGILLQQASEFFRKHDDKEARLLRSIALTLEIRANEVSRQHREVEAPRVEAVFKEIKRREDMLTPKQILGRE